MEEKTKKIKEELQKKSNPEKIKILSKFFKTGKGEYGEGDKFIGLNVPANREVAIQNKDAEMSVISELLESDIHEERLCALLILVEKYKKSDCEKKKDIFEYYIKQTKNINNWDLIDLSAPKIVGEYLLEKDKSVLLAMSKSKSMWERRIAIVSTITFIKAGKYETTLEIAKILLEDKEDLIQKAIGWMLREAGKKEKKVLIEFLNEYHTKMPRTMLRYSLEKLEKEEKEYYMRKKEIMTKTINKK